MVSESFHTTMTRRASTVLAAVSSRRNLLINTKMPFDLGHPREKTIDLFREPGITGALLFESFDAAVNCRNLGSYVPQAIMSCLELFVRVFELVNHFRSAIVDARVELGNVLFGRHMLDNMRTHFADFPERRLLSRRHMRQVYHTAAN